ncbi:DUF192 domain-containing protein [Shewanella gaetbuli]
MKKLALVTQDTQCLTIYCGNTFRLRFLGLLGLGKLTIKQGLLLSPCKGIHTLGMRYSLDVLYLDNNNKVVKIIENLSPLKCSWCYQASSVLELLAGSCAIYNIQVGDVLAFVELSTRSEN